MYTLVYPNGLVDACEGDELHCLELPPGTLVI